MEHGKDEEECDKPQKDLIQFVKAGEPAAIAFNRRNNLSASLHFLYNSLLYFHGWRRLFFGGAIGLIPIAWACRRFSSPSYALSISKQNFGRLVSLLLNNFLPSGAS